MRKTNAKIISAVSCLIFLLSSCASGKLQARDVSGVKEELKRMGYWNDEFRVYSDEGFSACGGLIDHSRTFVFEDYGKNKKQLDKTMKLSIPDDLDTYKKTEHANYVIYEKVNEYHNYCLYVRVDNTFLTLIGPAKEKEQILDLASQLGYYKK
ncbi:MAG: hypothetical protein K6C68_07015 [Ruminococcus sp.]|nr:hypothetical protein [Ruminococcus sp.]